MSSTRMPISASGLHDRALPCGVASTTAASAASCSGRVRTACMAASPLSRSLRAAFICRRVLLLHRATYTYCFFFFLLLLFFLDSFIHALADS
jgi:hypothetical protein